MIFGTVESIVDWMSCVSSLISMSASSDVMFVLIGTLMSLIPLSIFALKLFQFVLPKFGIWIIGALAISPLVDIMSSTARLKAFPGSWWGKAHLHFRLWCKDRGVTSNSPYRRLVVPSVGFVVVSAWNFLSSNRLMQCHCYMRSYWASWCDAH